MRRLQRPGGDTAAGGGCAAPWGRAWQVQVRHNGAARACASACACGSLLALLGAQRQRQGVEQAGACQHSLSAGVDGVQPVGGPQNSGERPRNATATREWDTPPVQLAVPRVGRRRRGRLLPRRHWRVQRAARAAGDHGLVVRCKSAGADATGQARPGAFKACARCARPKATIGAAKGTLFL